MVAKIIVISSNHLQRHMLDLIPRKHILFLDIETAPLVYRFDDLSETEQKLWLERFGKQGEDQGREQYRKAGVFSEFSRIICISCGFFSGETFRIKSFVDSDERALIRSFFGLLNEHYAHRDATLCAHNGKEFDFPFIARRALVNGLRLPKVLQLQGKKPWEIKHLDTMELWKFGDYKHFTSLNLLAHVFQIPTPKDDIQGSDVARVYWEEDNLPRIVTYCQKDVITIAQLYQRFCGLPLIPSEHIIFVNHETNPELVS